MTLEKLIYANEHFRGTELDEKKYERYCSVKKLGEALAQRNPKWTMQVMPVVDVSRHASMQITIPLPQFMTDRTTRDMLSELLALADTFVAATSDPKHLRLTFSVENMWSKWYTEGESVNGKRMWHVVSAHSERPTIRYEFDVWAEDEAAARAAAKQKLPEGYAISMMA